MKKYFTVLLIVIPFSFFACHSSEGTDLNSNNVNNSSNNLNNTNNLSDAGTDSDFSDALDFDGCVAVEEEATLGRGPADVIFVIDNTPSMGDEIEDVRANMNAFSQMVIDDGLDLHIVLISCQHDDCGAHEDWHGICIDAPVGAVDGCIEGGPYADSNEPNYLHVSEPVPSTKGLFTVIDTYDRWSSMIRDDSSKHIIVVSDDNDEYSAQQFIDELTALDSRFVGFQAHGIYSFLSKEDACAISDTEPCCAFSSPEGEGSVYRDLVDLTGGLSGDMCLQNFQPVFAELGGAVVDSAVLSCNWGIPDPPEGEELDYTKINVEFISSQTESYFIGRVDTVADCANVSQGWYYDDNVNPSIVYLCPTSCDWIQGDEGSQITVHFGCEQYIAPVE
jgi:hypothetical protein